MFNKWSINKGHFIFNLITLVRKGIQVEKQYECYYFENVMTIGFEYKSLQGCDLYPMPSNRKLSKLSLSDLVWTIGQA